VGKVAHPIAPLANFALNFKPAAFLTEKLASTACAFPVFSSQLFTGSHLAILQHSRKVVFFGR
jgi:hypothetical protein